MFAASQQRHQFSAFRLAQLNPVPYIHRLRYISMWSAAMDVGGWLRSLGLGQYEANFRDNKIDADVLPQLTADDLKEIGVSAVGDRRRLLAAIEALAKAPRTEAAGPYSHASVEAERRPMRTRSWARSSLTGSTTSVGFLGLAVGMATIFQFLQQLGNGRGTHFVTHGAKRRRQLVVALGDPSQRPHRVAHRRRLEQSLQVLQQRRVLDRQPRSAPALAPHLSR